MRAALFTLCCLTACGMYAGQDNQRPSWYQYTHRCIMRSALYAALTYQTSGDLTKTGEQAFIGCTQGLDEVRDEADKNK